MQFCTAPKADHSERFNICKLTFTRFLLNCLFFPGHKSQREDLDLVLFILEVRNKPFLTVLKILC